MKKILVIGDSCKDVFQYGRCERLSPEAPVPVLKPTKTFNGGGMAYNVHSNLLALGVDSDIITNTSMPIKTRYVDEVSNQMLLRIDENDKVNRIAIEELRGIDFTKYVAVVISDYNKGFLKEHDIEYLSINHPLVFMDTKKKIGEWCSDVNIIKINEGEFKENSEFLMTYIINHGDLIVTKGNNGSTWNCIEEFPIEDEHDVRDLSGAGDTFLAALVADYIKNNDIRSAIRFANKCASWVVSQRGVVVVDLDKIKIW